MFNSFSSLEKSVSLLALTVSLLSPSISFAMEGKEPSVLGKRKLEVMQEGESSEGGQRSAKRRKLEQEAAETEERYNTLKNKHLQGRHNITFIVSVGEELTKVLKALNQENDKVKFGILIKSALLHANNFNRLTETTPTYEWDICDAQNKIVDAHQDRNNKRDELIRFKAEDTASETSGAGPIGAGTSSLSAPQNSFEREWQRINRFELLGKVAKLFRLEDEAIPATISGAGPVGAGPVGAGAGSFSTSQLGSAKEEIVDEEEDNFSVASVSETAEEEVSRNPEQERILEEFLQQIEQEKAEIEELNNTKLEDLNSATDSQDHIESAVDTQARNINRAIDFVREIGKKYDGQEKVLLQQVESVLNKTASLTKERLENYKKMATEGAMQRDKLQDLIVRKERNLIDLVKRAQALGSEIEDYVPFQLGNAPDPDLEDEIGEESLSASSGLGLPVLGAGAGTGAGLGTPILLSAPSVPSGPVRLGPPHSIPGFGAGAGAKSSSAPGSH